MGEMIVNGGMETWFNNFPAGWQSPSQTLIFQQNARGRVHSGNYSANLENGAILSQALSTINPGCRYEFSFFANGEGSEVGLTSTVTFTTWDGSEIGGEIVVRMQDIPSSDREFGYYRIITSAAPVNVTGAIISFQVTASGDQSLNLDDVSFSVA